MASEKRKPRLPRITGVEVRRTASGKLRYRPYLPGSSRGEKIWMGTFDSAEEALEVRREANRRLQANLAMPRDTSITIKEAIDELEAAMIRAQRRPGTRRWYKEKFGSLEGTLLSQGILWRAPLKSIGQDHLEAWITRRVSAVHPNTVRAECRALNRLFRFAIKRRWITWNPLDNIEQPAEVETEMDWLSETELWPLVDAIEATKEPKAKLDAALIAAAAMTGLRRSELARIQVSSLRLETKPASLWVIGKRREEKMYIAPAGVPYLKRLAKDRPADGWLIPGETEEGRAKQIDRAFERWRATDDDLGPLGEKFPNTARLLKPHTMRHTFVTALLPQLQKLGKTEKEMLKYVRLRAIKTLHRYLHVVDDASLLDGLGQGRPELSE